MDFLYFSIELATIMIISPISYPGGKTRMFKFVLEMIPPGTSEIVSPFFGGGSIELACVHSGIWVHGYDVFDLLVNFWQVLLKDSVKLADAVSNYYPFEKEKFYSWQDYLGCVDITKANSFNLAVMFFVLNKCSFSASTLAGGMSLGHPRFTDACIKRLRYFSYKSFRVNKMSFEDSLVKHDDLLAYCDPPYMLDDGGDCLYGIDGKLHKSFNHNLLCEVLRERDKWILSYNDCEGILIMYEGYQVLRPQFKYGMSKDTASKEVVILSHDMSEHYGGMIKQVELF